MNDYSSSCAFSWTGNIQFMEFAPEQYYLKLSRHTTTGVQACENTPVEYNTLDLFEFPVIVNQTKSKSKIDTYPNPSHSYIFVYIPGNINNDVCEIFDNSGYLMKSVNVKNGENNIDINGLNSGSYYIRLKNSGLKSRFVVQ